MKYNERHHFDHRIRSLLLPSEEKRELGNTILHFCRTEKNNLHLQQMHSSAPQYIQDNRKEIQDVFNASLEKYTEKLSPELMLDLFASCRSAQYQQDIGEEELSEIMHERGLIDTSVRWQLLVAEICGIENIHSMEDTTPSLSEHTRELFEQHPLLATHFAVADQLFDKFSLLIENINVLMKEFDQEETFLTYLDDAEEEKVLKAMVDLQWLKSPLSKHSSLHVFLHHPTLFANYLEQEGIWISPAEQTALEEIHTSFSVFEHALKKAILALEHRSSSEMLLVHLLSQSGPSEV